MSILRKTCRNCTASKRKCIVQLPKCIRCAQRGLECRYELEHLSAPTGKSEELIRISLSSSTCSSSGYCILKTVGVSAPGIDPAISSPGNRDSMELIRLGYQSVPKLFSAGRPAIFVHPKLQMRGNHNYFTVFGETGKTNLSNENLRHLIDIDFQALPVEEALTALQALLIYLATFFLSSDATEQARVEDLIGVLSAWTQALLLSAQAKMSPNHSAWQKWLFGESVRRSIVMSYGLIMALSSFKYGYCSHWLFVESLPIDRRVGLWMAESPQAWIAAAGVRTGNEVGEQLNSFHEFSESAVGANFNFYGDAFLYLLAASHNGAGGKCEIRTSGNYAESC